MTPKNRCHPECSECKNLEERVLKEAPLGHTCHRWRLLPEPGKNTLRLSTASKLCSCGKRISIIAITIRISTMFNVMNPAAGPDKKHPAERRNKSQCLLYTVYLLLRCHLYKTILLGVLLKLSPDTKRQLFNITFRESRWYANFSFS